MTDTQSVETPEPGPEATGEPETPEEAVGETPAPASTAGGGEPPELETPSRPNFWQRPLVERYLTPILLPFLIVVGLVMFVLNISRIFLASHGHTDVIIGSLITIVILVGATILANAPRMRSSSTTLIVAGFVVAIMLAGGLTLGHSEVKEEAGLPKEGPAVAELGFESTNDLRFVPDAAEGPTGIVRITLTDVGGEHTFVFDEGGLSFTPLHVTGAGQTDSSRAFFGEAGEYTFYCSISGHRAAGMEGVITITGDPKDLATAEAEAEAAGGGEGGGEGPGGETATTVAGSGG
jgi:plastocyanin